MALLHRAVYEYIEKKKRSIFELATEYEDGGTIEFLSMCFVYEGYKCAGFLPLPLKAGLSFLVSRITGTNEQSV